MASSSSSRIFPNPPQKRITSQADVEHFRTTQSYAALIEFLKALAVAVEGRPCHDKLEGDLQIARDERHAPVCSALFKLLNKIDDLITLAPPLEQPSRFGNKGFQTFHDHLTSNASLWLNDVIDESFSTKEQPEWLSDPVERSAAAEELKVYFLDAFGNRTRIDYGTGHELNFMILLLCLTRLGALDQRPQISRPSSSSSSSSASSSSTSTASGTNDAFKDQNRAATENDKHAATGPGDDDSSTTSTRRNQDDHDHDARCDTVGGGSATRRVSNVTEDDNGAAVDTSGDGSSTEKCGDADDVGGGHYDGDVGAADTEDIRTTQLPSKSAVLRSLVFVAFRKYLEVTRRLQHVYVMEPAGSRGAWGLDDFSFLNFYLGASQLLHQSELRPSQSCDTEVAEKYSHNYLYLSGIRQILEVKKGAPFSETSPMLSDIRRVLSWKKVESGLLKMYEAEVLGKLPVVQHVAFGSLFPYS